MIKYILTIITICLLLLSNESHGQETVAFDDIVGKLAIFNTTGDSEKTYIATDKEFYINGETIWYKVFLVNGFTLSATDKSNVIYTELVNAKDSVLVRQILPNQGFGSQGNIDLPEDIEEGDYKLIAYTKYMLNEKNPVPYIKKITIKVPQSQEIPQKIAQNEISLKNPSKEEQKRPNITFYPEGGSIVSGIPGVLGVKATDDKGNGIALKGKIFDQNNNLVTVFSSFEFGLGKTTFTPELGKTYSANVVVNGKSESYPLPTSKKEGYVLGVQNFGKFLNLNIATNIENGLKGTILVAHIRGQTIFKHLEKTSNTDVLIKLITEKLEDGVVHFTLFTAEGEPVCERLVFVDNKDNDLVLTADIDSEDYGLREKAAIKLAIKDAKGRTLKGNLTTSIFTSTNPSSYSGNGIKSWLLLNSDLGGTVPDADFFFEKNDVKRKYLLDALMLTHGWRRFVWKDLLNNKVSKTKKFAPEKGIMIEGKITSFDNEYSPRKALASLSIMDKKFFQTEKLTNTQGKFSFGPFIFQDSLNVLIQAKPISKSKKGKNSDLAIYMEDSIPKFTSDLGIASKGVTKKLNSPEEYLEQAYKRKIEEFKYNPKVTQLKNVTVKAKREKTREELVNEEIIKFTVHGDPSNRVFTDSVLGSESFGAFNLLLQVPGVSVNGTYPSQTVTVRGGGSGGFLTSGGGPLLLLDGVQVNAGFLSQMRASEIMFVDVLKGSKAAIYGARAANGVIAFYTRRRLDVEDPKKKGILA